MVCLIMVVNSHIAPSPHTVVGVNGSAVLPLALLAHVLFVHVFSLSLAGGIIESG